LTWAAPTNAPITGYRLRIDSTPVRTLAPSTRYVLVGLALGQMHQVTLAAANTTGTGPPASLRVPMTARTRLDVTALALPRDRVQLNFSLRRTDLTRGLAAAPVTVQLRPRVGAAPKPFTVTTDTIGGGTVTLQASVTSDVRLSYPGTTLLTTSTATLVLTARPVLSARLSVSQVRLGTTATLSGATRATLVGALIYRQGFYSGRWHTWAATTVKPDGTYTFTIRPSAPVNYYRVWLPATPGHASATSPTLALRTR